MSNSVSRREFMNLLGATFGTSALIQMGSALSLMPTTAAAASLSLAAPVAGKGRVVVLGAGISGLTVAWELTKAGYDCTVLEASNRAGGRVMTVRSGDVVDEIGNNQVCEWDNEPHLYFNAGAARIPSTHRNLLGYCKELGVELEMFINESKTAYVQDDAMLGGERIRNGELSTNVRGFLAELFAKCYTSAQLDAPFSDSESQKILGLISQFGDLNENMLYKGSSRAGYVSGGFLDHGVQKDMVAFKKLMQSRMLGMSFTANEGETGPMLMQPVGGMDMVIKGFTRALGDKVQYKSAVMGLTLKDDGVDVSYERDGVRQSLTADYCFNCIPSHLMTGIPNNYPSDYLESMKSIKRGEAYKSAFQAKKRFWEDEDIYGGISWINAPIQQLWYPPHGIHKAKGILLAAYNFGGGMHFTKMSQAERVEAALAQGEKLHPNYRQMVEKPITIAWHRMNHMLGCSGRWGSGFGEWDEETQMLFDRLQQPTAGGRHYFIGDQVSYHGAWQESAIASAHWALADMNMRVRNMSASA